MFDSERLKPIIESLGEKLVSIAADKRLKDVQQTLTLVDGSIVEALPRIAMASFRDAQAGSGKKMKWTLHTHFEVDRHVPKKLELTPTAGGEHDERAVMERMVESDRTYVMDRGYGKFELFNRIVDASSSDVCRIRDNSVFTVLEEMPLTDADRASKTPDLILGALRRRRSPRFTLRGSQSSTAANHATPADSQIPRVHYERRAPYHEHLGNTSAEQHWDRSRLLIAEAGLSTFRAFRTLERPLFARGGM